jgi:CheY-like chemotaxis protein
LAGGIAHDFNNILAAIMGYVEIALFDLSEDSPAKYSFQQIFKASHRAKDLVNQILAFSRQTIPERKPVHADIILNEVHKLLRASIPSTIEIRQDFDCNHSTVLADPSQIHQIYLNLCTNAHHAMRDKGGILETSLKPVDFNKDDIVGYPGLKPGPYVKLSVSDTGHGMESAIVERVFDPYFTTKEKGVGTGMGLAVIHGIVKSMDGLITVYSEPNEGSMFNVYLPRIESGAEPERHISDQLLRGNETILFVDDEETLVELGRQMLERLGYQVITHMDSQEAINVFRANPQAFDLVVSDMTMPGMTGDELAIEMLKIRPDIPILICSGFSEKMTEEKARNIGVKAFLMKPLSLRKLSQKVRQAIDQ